MVKFDPRLPRSLPPIPDNMRPGPCAMGPADGEELTSMHVWIFQPQDDGVAVASGDSRQPQSANFKARDRWMVRTGLDPASQAFDTGMPAVAMAMALVTEGEKTEVKHWFQAIFFEDRDPDPDDVYP
jgi:hypothetical protein